MELWLINLGAHVCPRPNRDVNQVCSPHHFQGALTTMQRSIGDCLQLTSPTNVQPDDVSILTPFNSIQPLFFVLLARLRIFRDGEQVRTRIVCNAEALPARLARRPVFEGTHPLRQ